MAKMGLQFGLEGNGEYCKREFRWLFEIPEVCADGSPGSNALPPQKSARPNISFKEMEIKHLNEDVYYPAKPDWKPITIVLYDLKKGTHPVFKWLKEVYDPQSGKFKPALEGNLIKQCQLNMLDAVGNIIERWVFEDAWPNLVNFQSLDMGSSNVVMCEINLRYARAYVM